MSAQTPKRPRDSSQLAKLMVDLAAGNAEEGEHANKDTMTAKNPAAVSLGRLGGLKGGAARALKLSPEKRREIAQIAARSRWKNKPPK